jgi:putative tryptophan/tyrosine transport system substrate-binding protein
MGESMGNHIFCVALCVLHLALGFPAAAQQPKKVPRIALLSGRVAPTPATPDANAEAFRQGLRDLGYIEGTNILVEYPYAEAREDRIPGLVADLVQRQVDVLVSTSTAAILAAKQATKTIPIVMVTQVDPVATGIVESLARPGGNITGLTRLTRELTGKRLELLQEVVPTISRVGVLVDADSAASETALKEYEAAARALKITLQAVEVRSSNPDFEGAFQAAAQERVSALITVRSGLALTYRQQIANLVIKHRLPSISEGSDFVEAGGLMSYAANDTESFKRAAYYVDKLLKGAKASDLPIEQPTKFELIINLKTAKELGLTIPPLLLFRADKVIE